MIDLVRAHIVPAAYAVLPDGMRSDEATCGSGIISGAERRYRRRAAPHHNATVGGGHDMANQDSIRPVARSSNGTPLFRKQCPECGRESVVDRRKLGKPCHPCAMRARSTHGLSRHPLYRVLKGIHARCECQSATGYSYYGGRGISVCSEWRSNPAAFVEWAEQNGWVKGMEVDRVDPDGDYEPSNCRVVSHRENSRTRRNAAVTAESARQVKSMLASGMSQSEVARRMSIHRSTVCHIGAGRTWGDA